MDLEEERVLKTQQLGILIDNLARETSRGASLITISILDEILEGLLKNFLVKDKVTNQLLFTNLRNFSTRLNLCYALGLLQQNEYEEIDALNSIRNAFGHTWKDLDFDSPIFDQFFKKLPWVGPKEYEATGLKKIRFHSLVSFLFMDLMWRAHLVNREQRKIKTWPNKARTI